MQSSWQGGPERPGEAGPGVIVVGTQVANGKAGVIAGRDVALAVDAGIDDEEGRAVLDAAESLGRPAVELVITHGHADHVLGTTVFRGLPIHARAEVSGHMRAQLPAFADRAGEEPAALEARLGWPTHPFEVEHTIDLGGRVVRLLDTPGHAPGAICVYDSEAEVLFGGDTVVTAIPPAFSDGDAVVLERTLRELAALPIEVLIPGHGDVVLGRSAARAAIEWSADYLARCLAHVDRYAGINEAEMVALAPFEGFVGDHLPRDRFRMEWRHEQTLRTMRAQRLWGGY